MNNRHDLQKIRAAKKPRPGRRNDADLRHSARDQKPKRRWLGSEAKKWYVLLGMTVVISVLLFPNLLTSPKTYNLGDVAARDIKASREFLVENRQLTEEKRQEAAKAVTPVYDFDPAASELITRIRGAFEEGRAFEVQSSDVRPDSAVYQDKNQETAEYQAFKEQISEMLDIPQGEGIIDKLEDCGFSGNVEEGAVRLLRSVLRRGVVGNKMMLMNQGKKGIILDNIRSGEQVQVTDLGRFYDLDSARESIRQGRKELALDEASATLAAELAGSLIRPNLTFNKRETELRKAAARESVKPFYFKVKKGEMLVREGERITQEHLLKLSAHKKFYRQKDAVNRVSAMAVLIGFLISAFYVVGLMRNPSSKGEVKDLLFIGVTLLTVFLVVMASNLVAQELAHGFQYITPRALLFAVPVASGAMIISLFQGLWVAVAFSVIVSVLASLIAGGQVEFFIYYFISSLVAANGVRDCRDRAVFVKAAFKVSMVNVILAMAIEALYGSFYTAEALIAAGSALTGGILVGVIGAGIVPLIEMSFGYTTDIKLMELSNLDQPLLRELMVHAPGTYHHSVIVSNLVEATAKAVNANPLLAKVAAYYHDIGKMRKPLYFVENQKQENRHEKLAPSMSSLILISHVKDGVELAKKNKLGGEIIDIIRQHHGTSLITYFFEKAKIQSERKGGRSGRIKEEDFRYPGPKPQTKEAGLVMLADAVEAASRSLTHPTPARIKGMVQKIINRVFSDGQLDECELTLKDLHEIAKSFNKTLGGIFHQRIEYPEATGVTLNGRERVQANGAETGTRSRKGANGRSDQMSASNSLGEHPEDKTKTGKSLKRLGTS